MALLCFAPKELYCFNKIYSNVNWSRKIPITGSIRFPLDQLELTRRPHQSSKIDPYLGQKNIFFQPHVEYPARFYYGECCELKRRLTYIVSQEGKSWGRPVSVCHTYLNERITIGLNEQTDCAINQHLCVAAELTAPDGAHHKCFPKQQQLLQNCYVKDDLDNK